MNVIELENITFRYGRHNILENITLNIPNREFMGIIGPNGGGKTTLLKIIIGLLKPNEGRISILGENPKKAKIHIGYVPQQTLFDRTFPISVRDVVLMGRLTNKKPDSNKNETDNEIVAETLRKVDLDNLGSYQIGTLSEGQIQRVLLARALASEPKILLLDEPTSSVDTKSGKNIYELLKKLNGSITIILVSHDIGAISTTVNKIACLNKKLFCHEEKMITKEMLEKTYQCPVDLIAHGIPHRVLKEH
ncbi:metal ABC transporter ATP-binding protein [Bacteroidota bacterium]